MDPIKLSLDPNAYPYLISIHAPARGATAKLNKISVKFTEIIIKTEWEFKQYSSYGY